MANQIWINLPTKDLKKASEFFTAVGFTVQNVPGGGDDKVSVSIGQKNVIVMLFAEETFKTFVDHRVADAAHGNEVLLSIGADSKQEVDEMIANVSQAGGTIYNKPHDQGWMYGAAFIDLDGHRWNVLYMDMNHMPTK